MSRVPLLLLLILLLPGPAAAQGYWGRTLEGGHSISVDPRTRRVTVQTAAGERQLWDGVHQLKDGTTITVRSGVMVRNTRPQGLEGQQRRPLPAAVDAGATACLRLIRRTCGLHGECADSPACAPARQLLGLYREERDGVSPRRAFGEGYLPADVQCRQALDDRDFFVPCDRDQPGDGPTACQRLAERVCGPAGRCAGHEACAPARQLVETEARERRAALDPDAPTPATGQCRRALDDREFFAACEE